MMRLLVAWWKTYWRVALLCAFLMLCFTGLHVLGGGALRELSYALLLGLIACGAAAVLSLVRLGRQLRALTAALRLLPEEPGMLPAPANPGEALWREMALTWQQRAREAGEEAQARQRDAEDYFTLWLHQMKIPLAALDLLAQSEPPIDRTLMRQELLKARQYADMALTWQRLGSMEHDLLLEQVEVYPLCCACVRQLMPLFRCGQIALDMEPFPGSVLTDRKWLAVVVTQVLTNALKYTPRGGTITLRMDTPGLVTIRDTGIGVQPQDVPRVFERGFTGCAGRSHEKSTGIGLYLCHEIMTRLRHRIALESTPGEGTLVTLDLRRARLDDT